MIQLKEKKDEFTLPEPDGASVIDNQNIETQGNVGDDTNVIIH